MLEFIKKYYIYIGVGIVVLFSLIVTIQIPDKTEEFVPVATTNEPQQNEVYIYIDIKGSVQNPGVYKVLEGTRLFQLIHLAGGLTEDANEKALNQSILLSDEMSVYVPHVGEVLEENNVNEEELVEAKVNINTATKTELETLPGIGPSTAQSIIDYREEVGSFIEPIDITQVPGIGEATFNEIKDLITT